MDNRVDIAIIGAGVIGLAIANELSRNTKRTIAVLETNRSYGQETSSRNSEVIHSGIYYPAAMLKTCLCIEGNALLYKFCQQYHIAHKNLGKFIVGSKYDTAALEELYRNGQQNGVEIAYLDKRAFARREPCLEAEQALFIPSSGIIDAWGLMQKLYYLATANGTMFVFGSELLAAERMNNGYLLQTPHETIWAETLINAAGLHSDKIAAMVGIDLDQHAYHLYPCKGEYYRLRSKILIAHLIYPLPGQGVLGIHITPDLEGRLRLGPNSYYVDELSYQMDESHQEEFYQALRGLIPSLRLEDITPDFAGLRPKLQGPGEPVRDFVISEETDKGYPGLINLIGIESPGLTASLAIARYVKGLIPG
jgi:L-2-hydroxyglutarate oxidase LhgO